MAGLAAVLANLVNNVPATLVLSSVMPAGSTGQLLAMLLGVNVGPNLTYTGSLATLLWRRAVRAAGVEPSRRAFFRFAVIATPAALVLSTVMLWLTLQVDRLICPFRSKGQRRPSASTGSASAVCVDVR